MAINLSALAPGTTAATALSNLILVTPEDKGYQPEIRQTQQNQTPLAQRPPKFLFHYEGEQSVTLESDITDHYVEDNTAVQDQIALKPESVATHGYIGELNDVPPPALAALKTAANKLTTIGAYTPGLTTTALIAYSEAFFLYQVAATAVNSAVAAWSSLTGSGNQTQQQIAFQKFYGYWRDRTLFTIQTPWAIFEHMAIKSLRAVQDAETRVVTDFEITFKRIRSADSQFVKNSVVDGQLKAQAAPEQDLGTSSPVPAESLGDGLTTMGAP